MQFLDRIFNKRSTVDVGGGFDWTSFVKGDDQPTENALRNATYIKSLNILADTIAKLPLTLKKSTPKGEIELYNKPLYSILKLRANENMSMFDAMKALILMYKHNGIAGMYIKRDYKGQVEGLYPVEITGITIDDVGLINSAFKNKVMVDYCCVDTLGTCFDHEIIILRDNSFDGLFGRSTREYIKKTLNTSLAGEDYQNNLFSNGMTSKAVVQTVSDIKDAEKLEKVQEKFNRLYNSKNRVFLVPAGFNITPLNLSLVDSQFKDLKIEGKKDIANAVGVPYPLIERGTLTEEETISFLSNNISPILAQIEQEFNYKILNKEAIRRGEKIRFNVNAMLRTNQKVQQEILCEYVRNGIYTTNDVREILGMEKIEGADLLLYPSGQVTLDNIINLEASWVNSTEPPKGGEENEREGN